MVDLMQNNLNLKGLPKFLGNVRFPANFAPFPAMD